MLLIIDIFCSRVALRNSEHDDGFPKQKLLYNRPFTFSLPASLYLLARSLSLYFFLSSSSSFPRSIFSVLSLSFVVIVSGRFCFFAVNHARSPCFLLANLPQHDLNINNFFLSCVQRLVDARGQVAQGGIGPIVASIVLNRDVTSNTVQVFT